MSDNVRVRRARRIIKFKEFGLIAGIVFFCLVAIMVIVGFCTHWQYWGLTERIFPAKEVAAVFPENKLKESYKESVRKEKIKFLKNEKYLQYYPPKDKKKLIEIIRQLHDDSIKMAIALLKKENENDALRKELAEVKKERPQIQSLPPVGADSIAPSVLRGVKIDLKKLNVRMAKVEKVVFPTVRKRKNRRRQSVHPHYDYNRNPYEPNAVCDCLGRRKVYSN